MWKRCICCIVLILLCSGCQKEARGYQEVNKQNYEFPTTFMIASDNYFAYQPGYECSAFSSAYVLRHYGEKADAMELYRTFPNKLANGEGVFSEGIENFFESRGYKAKYIENASIDELKHEIAKGAPVIVHIHVEKPTDNIHATHYVPIVGYDEENFYFAESLKQYANRKDEPNLPYNRKTSIEDFKDVWNNIDGVFEQPYFKIEKK